MFKVKLFLLNVLLGFSFLEENDIACVKTVVSLIICQGNDSTAALI